MSVLYDLFYISLLIIIKLIKIKDNNWLLLIIDIMLKLKSNKYNCNKKTIHL